VPAPATNTNTATPATNTNTTPPPSAPACGQGGSCTATDIAAHSTRSNCWVYLTTVNKVYNVTAYVSNGSTHPGGDVIVPFCGKNITAPFTSSASGGKKHSTSALNSVLQAYYIGPYAP
jgi:cytochrome b involved in lipid metabolism